MFKKLANSIKEKINNYKEEDAKYQQLLQTSSPIKSLYPLTVSNDKIQEHKIKYITYNCPDINEEKATIITKLIPLQETLLEAYYSKDIITQKEYFIIPTNYRLWIISTEGYITYSLTQSNISIIKNNLMSKVILLNNTLFEINGSNDKITKLLSILTNPEERQNIISKETAYLCGITPIYQKINSLHSGISLDQQNNIVIHTKDNSYKCQVTEITNYELMLDNHTYLSKESYKKTSLGMAKTSCYKMTLRLTINNANQIEMTILEQSDFNTKYESTGSTYQTNLAFAIEIIDKIKDLTEIKY